jgi:hypothetical protein
MRNALAARFAALAVVLIGGCADSYTPPPGTEIAWETERVEPADTQSAALPAGCREYTQTVRIDGQEQQAQGQACLQPDGSWRLTPPPGVAPSTTTVPLRYAYPTYPYYPSYPYYGYYPYYPYYPWYGPSFFGSAFFFDRNKNKGGHHHHHRGGHGGKRGGGRGR